LGKDHSADATIVTTPAGDISVDLDLDVQERTVATELQPVAIAYTRTHGGGPPAEPTANHVALPNGYVLQEYTIDSVLGAGGFGITYLARDNNLQCQVAIKEYLPSDLAIRSSGQTVIPRSNHDTGGYHDGLERFLAETRVLASFRHPNIVRVVRFFEANSTAYMVMDYERGRSLRDWLTTHGPTDESTLRHMLLPLLDGIEVVHKGGIVHRDIKPGNIYVRDTDGSLVLLDFGSARQSTGAATRSLTSIVTPGYAPFEQYHTRGSQGPWSDLYAFGGVLYWLVTGKKPVEAPSRVKDDCLVPAVEAAKGRYSEHFLRTIDWALAVDEHHRPQSIAEFRPVFTGEATVPERPASLPPPSSTRERDDTPANPHTATPAPTLPTPASGGGMAAQVKIAIGGGIAALLAIILFMTSGKTPPTPAEPATAPTPTAPAKDTFTPPTTMAAPPPRKSEEKAKPKAVEKTHPNLATTSKTKAAAPVDPKPDTQPGPTAVLIFEIVPEGERGDIIIDGRKIGSTPPLKEFTLPIGKHKVEIHGDKLPYLHIFTVELAANEKKKIWAKFDSY
jgi:serine/threonine protein kinase